MVDDLLKKSGSWLFGIPSHVRDAIAKVGTAQLISPSLGNGESKFKFFQLMATLKEAGAGTTGFGNS